MRALILSALVLLAGCIPNLDNISPTAERPTKRSEVRAVPDAKLGVVAIFGGNEGPIVNQVARAKFVGDTWVFEVGKGWVKAEGDGPSKRARYAIGHDTDEHKMIIFGGRYRKSVDSGDYTLHNDLWSFDLKDRTWTRLDKGGRKGPSGRYYAAGAWDDATDTFWLWGGATNTSPLFIEPSDEVWSWTEADGWTEHETTGNKPSSRTFVGDAYDPVRNKLLVFGGQVGDFQSLAYQDFYALDLNTLTWERLHGGNGKAPSTRMHAHLAYDDVRDRYLLFGGHTDIGDGNDLWAFGPDTGKWTKVYEADTFTGNGLGCLDNPSEVPEDYVKQDLSAPERRHRGMHAIMYDNLWVFGGMHAECSDHLDDTWRYDLESDTWVELIEARTGESCARRGDDCECLCL